MSASIPLPPLAGLASYAQAAMPGYGVEANVARLLRYAWIEKRLMDLGLYWLAPTPEWEAKEALGLEDHRAVRRAPPGAARGLLRSHRAQQPRDRPAHAAHAAAYRPG